MSPLHRFQPICAIVLAALLLGGCGRASGENATPTASPNPTAIPVKPSPDGLEVVLQAPAKLPEGDSVELEFTLVNHGQTDLYVLQWYTPFEGFGGEIFRVKRDGRVVPYQGPLAMRGDPTPEAYVFLGAGASVSVVVDLVPAYDFSEPGTYTIAFISPNISHLARTEEQMATSVDELGPVAMPSSQVLVTIGAGNQ